AQESPGMSEPALVSCALQLLGERLDRRRRSVGPPRIAPGRCCLEPEQAELGMHACTFVSELERLAEDVTRVIRATCFEQRAAELDEQLGAPRLVRVEQRDRALEEVDGRRDRATGRGCARKVGEGGGSACCCLTSGVGVVAGVGPMPGCALEVE